jgi:hypothetical protein
VEKENTLRHSSCTCDVLSSNAKEAAGEERETSSAKATPQNTKLWTLAGGHQEKRAATAAIFERAAAAAATASAGIMEIRSLDE